jgi:hypothetical protein
VSGERREERGERREERGERREKREERREKREEKNSCLLLARMFCGYVWGEVLNTSFLQMNEQKVGWAADLMETENTDRPSFVVCLSVCLY